MYAKLFLTLALCLALTHGAKLQRGSSQKGTQPPGQICGVDEDCVGGPERAWCAPFSVLGYLCQCRADGYIENAARSDCIPKRLKGEECDEWIQCQLAGEASQRGCLPNEDSSKNICRCADSAVSEGHWCYKRAERLWEDCEVDIQCKTRLGDQSWCLRKVHESGKWCECLDGSGPNSNHTQCVPGPVTPGSILPHGECTVDEDCHGFPERSHCLHHIGGYNCFCNSELYITNENGTDCIPKRSMGETCEESVQCQISGAVEDKGCFPSKEDPSVKVCTCSDTGVEGDGHQWCYKKATHVGELCIINSQCTANLGELSRCDGIVCHCKPGAEPNEDETSCVPVSTLF